MSRRNSKSSSAGKPVTAEAMEKRRKKMEGIATFGLILVAVAMISPFASFMGGGTFNPADSFSWIQVYKWVYAAGALIFTFARLVNVSDPGESLRIRRLRRLEFWAGMAFCIGAFFWFYNLQRFTGMVAVGPLAVLKDTVMFSLVGALIQLIASWMIVWRQKKEQEEKK